MSVAAALYGVAARLHRLAYDRGWSSRRQLACKVVSVGNLVSGGAGKTPTAAWVAAALRARGHRVVLASRGYGGSGHDAVRVVSDGRYVRGRSEVVGDEAMLLAALAPGVPVIVGARRDLVGQRAVAAFDAHVLVLDDGFQHHRLVRDVDLVTVHGSAGFGNRHLLPRGPLRERPETLCRADAIGIVDGPLGDADAAFLDEKAPLVRRFEVERVATQTRPLGGGAHAPVEALVGRPVGLLCGIARPASFRETVEGLGACVVAERNFADHHVYQASDLRGLEAEAAVWLTTEKDAGKLLPRWIRGVELLVLSQETRVRDAEAFLDWLEDRLRAKAAGRNATVPGIAHPPRAARDHTALG
ncbi:MAG: tetraacyldisaccharide 4'-kinase [bacterium]|nr:tetraacyldisaccharide 4'-kinase [bacterium]